MVKLSTEWLLKIARIISFLFSPINSLLVYLIIYSSKNYSLAESRSIFLPILFLLIIPIFSWIFWNVKKKRYTDSDVSDRKQRKSLYFFIAGSMISYLTFVYLRYERIDWVLLFLLILLMVMQISNYFIKSSMHTAFNIFVAALMFTLNPFLGIIWLLVTILVGRSRIILKRHTLPEVLSGAAIATVISFIYLYTIIQNI
jgi:membrane-associated phospholipid phosphatase